MKNSISNALIFVATIAGFAALTPAMADDNAPEPRPTFYKDVLPVMQKNCQDCHRPEGLNLGGMIAPMPLISYEDVRPWAKSIASQVKAKQMPPWHAGPEFHGNFRNERTMTSAEIDMVLRWVETGAPRGNPADGPEPVVWGEGGWAIGEPDFILTLDEPFFVGDDVDDLNVDLFTQLTEEHFVGDQMITAIEFRPGSDVVHHIIGLTIPPAEADAQGIQMIGGIAPGTAPTIHPEGYGVKLHANSRFIFQMHYNKEAGPDTGKFDRSEIAFRFADKPVKRLYYEAIGDIGRLYVPAGEAEYRITSKRKFGRDVRIFSYLPHMHLRGSYSKYHAIYPDGTEETLLEVPAYDFNWQTAYEYSKIKDIPAGTTIEVTMGYDNSEGNAANPDPTVDVRWGGPTYDEMNLGWTVWGYADPTDNDPIPNSIGGGNDGT